ncbi:uncharacterized protein TNCV_4858731 [Trichonephila clavipes]|nr:uncharacterized protein TNCV_4858731 [Trichonephila clavipes]
MGSLEQHFPTLIYFDSFCGHGNLVVKVTDSSHMTLCYMACHGFESSTSEDSPCRGAMHVKSVESSNVLTLVWLGNWKRGVAIRCRTHHLAMIQHYDVRRQKP